jgi:hypothetical protein
VAAAAQCGCDDARRRNRPLTRHRRLWRVNHWHLIKSHQGSAVKRTLPQLSLHEANAFIENRHRHHGGRRGAHGFAVDVRGTSGELRGVRSPANRLRDRCATAALSRCPEAAQTRRRTRTRCSTARSGGRPLRWAYKQMITYTMPEESGSSFRAIGMHQDSRTDGRPWNRPN